MKLFRRRADRPLNCMQVGRRLQRYLDGEIDELTARRIVRHLEDCRRCGLAVATYSAIKTSVARHGSIPDPAVDRLREFGERLVREGLPADDESTGTESAD